MISLDITVISLDITRALASALNWWANFAIMAKRTADERDGTDSELQPDYDSAVFRDDEFDVSEVSCASPNAKIHGVLTQILVRTLTEPLVMEKDP